MGEWIHTREERKRKKRWASNHLRTVLARSGESPAGGSVRGFSGNYFPSRLDCRTPHLVSKDMVLLSGTHRSGSVVDRARFAAQRALPSANG